MGSFRSSQLLSGVAVLLALCTVAAGQGLPVQFGLLPLGDLTTSDQAGPYNVPDVQAFEVRTLAKTSGWSAGALLAACS